MTAGEVPALDSRSAILTDMNLYDPTMGLSLEPETGRAESVSYTHLLGPLGGDGEVGKNYVNFSGLEILDAVGGLGGDEVHLHAQVLPDAVGKIYVIPLIVAVLVHVCLLYTSKVVITAPKVRIS